MSSMQKKKKAEKAERSDEKFPTFSEKPGNQYVY